jgi:predicted HD phosphohydrolase
VTQGDSLSAQEIEEFAAEPLHEVAIVLRRADESAKVHGRVVDPLDAWVPVLRNLAVRPG